jgi:predicted amidophosphoribosyltransferase
MDKRQREHTMGAGGECVCPKCNATVPHRRGVPCQEEHCPQCGAKMLRVGSPHHELWLQKHSS